MPDPQVVTPADVGPVPDEVKRPPAPKPRPDPIRKAAAFVVQETPAAVSKLPREARVTWGANLVDSSGDPEKADVIHESVVTSVVVDFQDGRSAPAGSSIEFRRAVGELELAPAYDLNKGASELSACKTIEDVAVLFTRILAAGAKS